MGIIKKYFIAPVKGALVFLDNATAFVMNRNIEKGPMFVGWDIAASCNARCRFCNRWNSGRGELSTLQKLDIIDQLGRQKVWMLSLAGGEPFCVEGFDEILSRIKQNKMILNICTNGLLLKEHAESVVRNNVRFITVSVDDCVAKNHDADRGVEGLFDELSEGIEFLKSIRRNTHISVRVIVHAKNVTRLDEIISYWKGRVDDVMLQPITFREEVGMVPSEEFLNPVFDPEKYQNTLLRFGLDSKFNQNIPYFQGRELKEYRCYSGVFFIEIDEKGLVWNCPDHHFRLGDLKENSFAQILGSGEAKKVIEEMRRGVNCSCGYSCTLLNSYLSRIPFL